MVAKIFQKLGECKLVSIVRGIQEDKIVPAAEALYNGGIRAIEVTLNTPGALRMIEVVKASFGDRMIVGAGTVLDSETAASAIRSGADFILSPTLSLKVIETCCRYSKLAVPGVLTPTEILTAWEAGAQLVKVFPARVFGPEYIKDIKGPLPQVEIMPVGGVSLNNAADFMKCGAYALGIGTALANPVWVNQGDFQKVTQAAADFVRQANSCSAY
ncbi:MAG TPA: bifunctional 4-hydroxy-2-oxoglutarate aldolase/2-dehydro-3-deoxy-phosphogluconate aldolase [Clostridiales bacterium]|nr:bifunctional 4-hydroxy-2-oxoglutarate aldolase/2-dehydro-3-deoxy-phosphogluconate aldolase [Clostridiales bacterium]